MLNDETRRKLRLMNVGEFIDELEIQQQDPQTLALPFDDRFHLSTGALLLIWLAAGSLTIAAALCSRDILALGKPSWGVHWQKKPAGNYIKPDTSASLIFWKNTPRNQCFPAERTRC